MGLGIATQSALYGYRTIVHDVDAGRLASVTPKAEAVLDELIEAGRTIHPQNFQTAVPSK
jgi:3-hydroxybutyryl-CoA dehydrogenase